MKNGVWTRWDSKCDENFQFHIKLYLIHGKRMWKNLLLIQHSSQCEVRIQCIFCSTFDHIRSITWLYINSYNVWVYMSYTGTSSWSNPCHSTYKLATIRFNFVDAAVSIYELGWSNFHIMTILLLHIQHKTQSFKNLTIRPQHLTRLTDSYHSIAIF